MWDKDHQDGQLVEEAQSRIVRSQVRLALYRNSDVGEIDGQTLVAQTDPLCGTEEAAPGSVSERLGRSEYCVQSYAKREFAPSWEDCSLLVVY
jgi:hypothetical protein